MYNPVDCLVPGASGAPDSLQYKPAQRMILRHGALIDHEATRGAMRAAGTWIHPSDLTNQRDYWYAARPVPEDERDYDAWVRDMRPAAWIAHVGAVGKSALDRTVRDPAYSTNREAQQQDAVALKPRPGAADTRYVPAW